MDTHCQNASRNGHAQLFARLYDNPDTTQQLWEDELWDVVKLHRQLKLPPARSIVYPPNQIKYLDTLPK